tara:strand:+ start:2360 stop:2500 length:141 start_codon:yes stop_codon:yes gene_type:complete
MKAFLLALVALVVISVGANQILLRSGFSSAVAGSSEDNVRIGSSNR